MFGFGRKNEFPVEGRVSDTANPLLLMQVSVANGPPDCPRHWWL